MKNIIILMVVFLSLVLLPLSLAEVQSLGFVKVQSCVQLVQSYGNSTYTNVTRIQYPDKTIVNVNYAMAKNGGNYNYTFCDTNQLGEYIVTTCTDVDKISPCIPVSYDFQVTATGSDSTTSKSVNYTIVIIVAFIIFAIFLIAGLYLPGNNKSDEMTGYVIAVSNLKYVKILCFALAYLTATVIMYLMYQMSYAYLDMGFLSSIFQWIFYIMVICILPLFIVGIYITIANWNRDNYLMDQISRGFKVREM